MRPLHNCRVKHYPDGVADIVVASAPFGGGDICREPLRFDDVPPEARIPYDESDIFQRNRRIMAQEADYEALERIAIQDDGPDDLAAQKRREASLERSKRRARIAVRDLGLCNDFRFFVTLTLDKERIGRYDAREVLRHLNCWLDNNVRRKGLKYVLVPEYHKDRAIHFHGFFNDALEAVDSGHKDRRGHTVYNLPGWGWGFSTAIELYGERAAAVNYTCKYIAKAQEKIGGRWYYSGGGLQRPDVEWCDVDFASFAEGLETFTVDGVRGVRFAQVRTDRTDVSRETSGGHSEAVDPSEEMGEALPGPMCAASPVPPLRPLSGVGGCPCGSAVPGGGGLPSACQTPSRILQDSCRILQFSDCQTSPQTLAPQALQGGGHTE